MVLASGVRHTQDDVPPLSQEALVASIVANVVERLEVFSALAVNDQSAELRKVHAARITLAVIAMAKGRLI